MIKGKVFDFSMNIDPWYARYNSNNACDRIANYLRITGFSVISNLGRDSQVRMNNQFLVSLLYIVLKPCNIGSHCKITFWWTIIIKITTISTIDKSIKTVIYLTRAFIHNRQSGCRGTDFNQKIFIFDFI